MWFRILIGAHTLTETSRRPLSSDFTVDFDQNFAVVLNDLPESIGVEIFEQSSKVAVVYIPIPDATTLSNHPIGVPIEFTSADDHARTSSTSAVGSGLIVGQPLTSGVLKAGASWAPDSPPPASVAQAILALVIFPLEYLFCIFTRY